VISGYIFSKKDVKSHSSDVRSQHCLQLYITFLEIIRVNVLIFE
jgi:hypothetical protein